MDLFAQTIQTHMSDDCKKNYVTYYRDDLNHNDEHFPYFK